MLRVLLSLAIRVLNRKKGVLFSKYFISTYFKLIFIMRTVLFFYLNNCLKL